MRYPSLRKYFAEFIHLPFAAEQGSEILMQAVDIVPKLDCGALKKLPSNAPAAFVPRELRRGLRDSAGNFNRNAWETGLAMALKDALRAGDLYLPQSKQHVSFWDLTLSDTRWQAMRDTAYSELQQPHSPEARAILTRQFHAATALAKEHFERNTFAEIRDGQLKLKRDDKFRTIIPGRSTSTERCWPPSFPRRLISASSP